MTIRGIPTGDGECWCFLVSRNTYRRVIGRNPSSWDRQDRGVKKGSAYKYRLYPERLIGWELRGTVVDLEVSAKPVKKAGKR